MHTHSGQFKEGKVHVRGFDYPFIEKVLIMPTFQPWSHLYHLCTRPSFTPQMFLSMCRGSGEETKFPPVHSPSYEESDQRCTKGYEEEFLHYLEKVIRDLDRRISRGKERLQKSAEAKQKVSLALPPCSVTCLLACLLERVVAMSLVLRCD